MYFTRISHTNVLYSYKKKKKHAGVIHSNETLITHTSVPHSYMFFSLFFPKNSLSKELKTKNLSHTIELQLYGYFCNFSFLF